MVRVKAHGNAEISEQMGKVLAALSLSMNTAAVDWKRLQVALEGAPPVLSDTQRIALVVRFANSGQLSGEHWNQLVGLRIQQGGNALTLPSPMHFHKGTRAVLGGMLDRAGGGQVVEQVEKELRGTILLHPENGSHRVIAANVRAALAYSMVTAARSGTVRQCAHEPCAKFFFPRVGPGAPPRFCSLECSRAFDTQQAAVRMRRLRSKRK